MHSLTVNLDQKFKNHISQSDPNLTCETHVGRSKENTYDEKGGPFNNDKYNVKFTMDQAGSNIELNYSVSNYSRPAS